MSAVPVGETPLKDYKNIIGEGLERAALAGCSRNDRNYQRRQPSNQGVVNVAEAFNHLPSFEG